MVTKRTRDVAIFSSSDTPESARSKFSIVPSWTHDLVYALFVTQSLSTTVDFVLQSPAASQWSSGAGNQRREDPEAFLGNSLLEDEKACDEKACKLFSSLLSHCIKPQIAA